MTMRMAGAALAAAWMTVSGAQAQSTLGIPSRNWSGIYAGAHAGVSGGDVATALTPEFGTGLRQSTSTTGSSAGGQIGVNVHLDPILLGIELDLSKSTLSGDLRAATNRPGDVRRQTTGSSDLTWLTTLRPRLGVTFGNLLVYGTGGVAFADAQLSLERIDTLRTVPGQIIGNGAAKSSRIAYGTALGGGVEYMLLGKFIVRAEYLRLSVEKTGDVRTGSTVDHKAHWGRVGINYLF